MNRDGSANSLLREESGATFVEFTVVFPVLMLLVLGMIDLSLLAIDWAAFNRATYAGARFAAISAPVATGINAPIAGSSPGKPCIKPSDGTPTGYCTARSATTCIATGAATGGTCTNGYTFNDAALNAIRDEMKSRLLLDNLDRRQISITYTPTNVGYVSREDGYPLNITVSTRCLAFKFNFLAPLMRWATPTTPVACAGITTAVGFPLPAFSTTLPSEDLATN